MVSPYAYAYWCSLCLSLTPTCSFKHTCMRTRIHLRGPHLPSPLSSAPMWGEDIGSRHFLSHSHRTNINPLCQTLERIWTSVKTWNLLWRSAGMYLSLEATFCFKVESRVLYMSGHLNFFLIVNSIFLLDVCYFFYLYAAAFRVTLKPTHRTSRHNSTEAISSAIMTVNFNS